ncbi:MAG: type IV pilus assembly protein PilM [bacterium]|nr:type IV pilus assembly protein PilM [bacterium]
MENPFKGVLKFSSLMGKKDGSVVGIDIGSSFAKVVQLKKKGGRAILETYGELALGPYAGLRLGQMTNLPSEKIAEALADILKESNVTTKNAALSIPFSASLVSIIELPKVSESQLAAIIPIEARKYIPVPIAEVSLDWWAIPASDEYETAGEGAATTADGKGKTVQIMLAAIHNDAVAKYRDVAKQNALENPFFEIEIFSTIRSSFGRDMKLVMVLDMGAGKTKLSVVEYGVVRASHVIDRGSQDITVALSKSLGISFDQAEALKREKGLTGGAGAENAAETVRLSTDYLLAEVNRVLLNYEKKHNATIGKVILTGGGVLLKGFKEEAARTLQAEVAFGDPFAKVEAPAFLDQLLQEAGPEFAVAIGLALKKLQDL